MPSKVTRAGDRALLVDLGEVTAAELRAAAMSVRSRPGVLACIAGQSSLYVVFDHEPALEEVSLSFTVTSGSAPVLHRMRVSFDDEYAPDLGELLQRTGASRGEFLDRVAALRLTARYLGFRAGFAYLDGWPPEWSMPRRPTSRPVVPRGSFAIAGAVAGFYPIDTPGGWNILGRTDAELWNPERDPANLIAAGDEIIIEPTDEMLEIPPEPVAVSRSGFAFEILRNGQLCTTVGTPDWGKVEHGLPPGGAFDARSAAVAGAIAGNSADEPLLECALVGPRLRFTRDCVVAWCGADSDLPQGEPIQVREGDEIEVGRIRSGLRGWLAAGPGGRAADATQARSDSDRLCIGVMAGPHETALRTISCEVTPQLNRVGIRLRPLSAISFAIPADLPSCGMQFGTLQLHPDGSIIAMGPDHPITGGYLQPLTVRWEERWKLAQLSPGEHVTFVCA